MLELRVGLGGSEACVIGVAMLGKLTFKSQEEFCSGEEFTTSKEPAGLVVETLNHDLWSLSVATEDGSLSEVRCGPGSLTLLEDALGQRIRRLTALTWGEV